MAKNAKKKRSKKNEQKCNCPQELKVTIQNDGKCSFHIAILHFISTVWDDIKLLTSQLIQILLEWLTNLNG